MKRLGPVKARKVEKALRSLGYELVRSQGTHRIYRHTVSGRTTTVAFHTGSGEVPKGTIKAILADTGVTWKEFSDRL